MIIFKKGEWKIFWPFYLALFIGISTPGIFVIQTLFFLSRGFTLTQLGIGFGLVSLFTLLAEIPTGAVADIFGKKTSIQVHWLLHTITSFSFIFVQSPWQMYLLFSIEGISGTFASGAFDALPYEMCKKAKRKDLINEFYAKISMITQFSHVIAYFGTVGVLFLLGSEKIYTVFGMTFRGMDFLWPIGGLGYFFAFLIFFNVKEEVKREKVNIKKNFVKTYRLAFEGIKYSCTHHVIRKLFIASFFLAGSFVLFAHHVHQSFLIGFGFNAEKIAIIIALAAIIGTIFSLIPKSIEKKFKTEKQFIQITIILQLGLLLALVFFSKNLKKTSANKYIELFENQFLHHLSRSRHRCLCRKCCR